MRLPYRGVLLTVISVLAMSVVTAASASAALPEFKPAVKDLLESSGGSVTWTYATSEITCKNSSSVGTGEVTGARALDKLVVKLTECESIGALGKGSDCAVKSAGAKEGEIVTNALKGELGTVKTTEAPSGVGLLLEPETGKVWTQLVENACTLGTKVEGTLAAEVATTGKLQTTNTLVFGTTTGKQSIKEIKLDSGEVVSPKLSIYGIGLTLGSSFGLTFEKAMEVS